MIAFGHPEALFLLPVWGVAVWWRRRMFLRPLRVVLFLLFLVAWLDPAVNRITPGVDVWVMADRSESAAETVAPRLREMETLLRETRGRDDRLFFVDFAEEAVQRDRSSDTVLGGRKDATAIGNALQFTLSRLEAHRNARILMVTDGYATDALDTAGERLLEEGTPLDVRLMRPAHSEDVRVERLSAPARVRPGEPFLIEGVLTGPVGTNVTYRLTRDGAVLAEGRAELDRGRARLQWTGGLERPGAARYGLEIEAPGDAYAGNNRQGFWVEARGGQRVLLITAYGDDPVGPVLRDAGLEVDTVTEPGTLDAGDLTGTAAVLIHNVYAPDVPRPFLDALTFFVREQGGGLMMIGGKASFGSGGYFESPVDPLLPVSMELKEEDRRLSTAMAVVMDRSGSMSAAAGGMTKMELANAGAARAVELLGAMDAVTVFAVDTEAHQILPLSKVGAERGRLIDVVSRIRSAGGGIYVFNGMQAAWRELEGAPQTRKHVILFADAADAEQPMGVEKLVEEMTGAGATVSVIALGSESDADAPFLKQIAEDGGGRIFFNADPATLPAVFAQETVTVSRSAFLDEPTGIAPAAGWRELAAAQPDWPSRVDGYNLSYLREGAAESLRTTDEYQAPLIAHWRRGAGRVAAVSFPLGGEFSGTVRSWPEYGDLVRTLTRWVVRPELPPGLALRLRRHGETVRVRLHADEEWRERLALDPPELVVAAGRDVEGRRIAWRRVRPGVLEAELRPTPGQRVRGALKVGDRVLPFGPVSGPEGAEWAFDPDGPAELRRLSAASGGVERVDLAEIWRSPARRKLRGTRDVWLIAFGCVFLFEAFWSRLGGRRPEFDFRRRAREAPSEAVGASVRPEPVVEKAREPERRSAFRQARRRGRL